MEKQLAFYSPEPAGRVTGGFLYNQQLQQQLQHQGWHVQLVTRCEVEHQASLHLVDSIVALDYLSARQQPDKAVFIYHLPPFAGQSVPEYWLRTERQLIEQARIVVTGNQCFELLMARHRIPEAQLRRRIRIITPGIPDNWQVKSGFASLPEKLIVLASVIPQKGIEAIVQVLTELRQYKWNCTIYGETQQEPEFYCTMLESVAKLGLSERIIFAGTVSPQQVNQVMCDADLLLNFSQFETYSMVTAEAIATGLPVLSTPVGELAEFQQASNILYLSSHAFTEQHLQLRRLLTDVSSYQALCRALHNRERFAGKSWISAAQQWLDVIQNVTVEHTRWGGSQGANQPNCGSRQGYTR